jgi:hypothetical protein
VCRRRGPNKPNTRLIEIGSTRAGGVLHLIIVVCNTLIGFRVRKTMRGFAGALVYTNVDLPAHSGP